jgi:hypothetical protein
VRVVVKAEDCLARLDSKSLNQVGSGILYVCQEGELWNDGYKILYLLHDCSLHFYKYTVPGGKGVHPAMLAMEVCMQCAEPQQAVMVLNGK